MFLVDRRRFLPFLSFHRASASGGGAEAPPSIRRRRRDDTDYDDTDYDQGSKKRTDVLIILFFNLFKILCTNKFIHTPDEANCARKTVLM